MTKHTDSKRSAQARLTTITRRKERELKRRRIVTGQGAL